MVHKGLLSASILGTIIVANVIGAKIISGNLEDGIKSSVAAYSEQLRVKMEVANFEPSWFSSKFQLRVSLPTSIAKSLGESFDTQFVITDDETSSQIIFDQNIDHGPIAFTENGPRIGLAFWHSEAKLTDDFIDKLLVDDDQSDEDREEFKMLWSQIKALSNIELDGSANLLGGISNNIHGNGGLLDIQADDKNIELTINPFDFEWSLNSSYDASEIALDWQGMSANSPGDVSVKFSEFTATSELERVKPKIWLGKSVAHFGSMSGTGPDDAQFNFGGLDVTSSVNVDLTSDSFSFDALYNSKEFNFKSTKAIVDFEGLNFDISVSEIPFSLLEMLFEISDNMQTATPQELSETGTKLIEQFKTINYNGNINIDFKMKNMVADVNQIEKALIEFEPLELTYKLNNDKNESDFSFNWKGLKFDVDNKVNIAIDAITSNAHQYKDNSNIWLGNSDFHISNFKVKDNKNLSAEIDNIGFEGALSPSDDKTNAQVTFNNIIENVNIESPKGNLKLSNQNSDWVVDNIPLELVELYQDYTNPFQIEKIQNPTLSNEKAMEKLSSISMQPTINMNKFDIILNTGTLKSNAIVNFNEAFLANGQDPRSLLDLTADIEFSETFVHETMDIVAQQNPQIAAMTPEQRIQLIKGQLMQFVQQGILIAQENGTYTSAISTINNFIAVNEIPMIPLVTPIAQ